MRADTTARSFRAALRRRKDPRSRGRVKLHTSLKPEFSCCIATMQIDGLDSQRLTDWLWSDQGILTTAIKNDEFQGIRVTPSVYTTLEEIDRFCKAVEWAIVNGLPGGK